LSTNYGVVYAIIDPRGSGGQSNEFTFQTYRKFGTTEMTDTIAIAQALLDQFSFLDPSRAGVWGWSYGGYATLNILVYDDNNVFSCGGISVAPVTSWLLYDTIYTERYMGLPTEEDNLIGYETGGLLDANRYKKLRDKRLQINHGVADDNVHYQHTMLLVRGLQLEDIQFEYRSFPDSNHGINNGVRRFLYHGFDDFWSQCFGYTVNHS